jgi:sterol desaturase/sphingolipid hydroxylase (fatty acid hydroxylase superfamily)
MDLLEVINNMTTGLEKLLFLCSLGLAIEYIRPNEKEQPARAILFNYLLLINFVVLSSIALWFFGQAVAPTVKFLGGPLIDLGLPDTKWAWFVHLGIYILLYDLGYYWFHRCQHTWNWFWSHHKLHHTDENLNATSAFRHHWMENVYRIPFITIPMAFLIEIDSSMPVILFDLMLIWAIFTHLNVRLELGWLTPVIAGPQVHRIHHSNLREHQDRNFAAYLPIWDILFGTWHRPAKNEFPPTGTLKHETFWSLWDANTRVFKEWYGLLRSSPLIAGRAKKLTED